MEIINKSFSRKTVEEILSSLVIKLLYIAERNLLGIETQITGVLAI